MRKVLIMGVCGLLGANLAKKLIKNEDEIIGLDNLSTGDLSSIYQHLKNPNFNFIQKDILEGIDIISDITYYLCGLGDLEEYFNSPFEFFIKQIKMAKNALLQAKLSGAKIVFALPYKMHLENPKMRQYADFLTFFEDLILSFLKEHNIYGKIAKISSLYGPYMPQDDKRFINRAIKASINQEEIVLNQDCEKYLSYCPEVASCLEKIMENYYDEDVIEISSLDKYKLSDIARLIIKYTKSRAKLTIKSPEFVKATYLPNPKHDEFILKTSILEGIVQTIDWKKFMMF